MTITSHFDKVLLEWVGVSMHRSMQGFTRWMNESGLSKSQIGTLMRLYYHGTCPVSGIGDDLGITAAAASQVVDRLVQMGLLDRSEDPDDRRIKQVSLSPAGLALIQQGVEARLGWLKEIGDYLTPAEQAEIVQSLEKLIQTTRQNEGAVNHAKS